jgi:glycosyltransferase involved in cell wall biosynthesis
MKQPWLSIIIPVYNGEKYLTCALNSILSQVQDDIECIVIDDGSTDSTFSILKSFETKLPLKIISQERQGNWVVNSNNGLRVAIGEYACFLHQDDMWLKNRLTTMKPLVEQFPDVSLFITPSVFINSSGKKLGLWQCPLPRFPMMIDSETIIGRLLMQNFISMPAPIFKREEALAVDGMDPDLWYTADWDFWLKLASAGKTLYYPEPLSAFRIHSGSQTVRRSLNLDDFKSQMKMVLEKHLDLLDTYKKPRLSIRNIAYFSIELNTALAGKIHGKNFNSIKLLASFFALGPTGWHMYLNNSCIFERVLARLKAL